MSVIARTECINEIWESHRGLPLEWTSISGMLREAWDKGVSFASSQEKGKGRAGPDVSKESVWRVSVVDDAGMTHDFTTKQKFAQGVSGVDDWIGWERYEGGYVQFDLKSIKSIHSMPIGKDGD